MESRKATASQSLLLPGHSTLWELFRRRAIQIPSRPEPWFTASRLRLGQPLAEENLTAAQKRLNDLMVANGYYQSVITHQVERNPNTLEANVTFTIRAGRPARVSSVQFGRSRIPVRAPDEGFGLASAHLSHRHQAGTRTLPLATILCSAGAVPGQCERADKGSSIRRPTPRGFVVKVQSGPLLRVRVRGASISSSRLQNLLPLYHDGVVDEPSLTLCSKLLEGYFQEKGYFDVKVKATRTARASPQPLIEVLFSVELEQRGEFAGFGVKGNTAIPSSVLLAAITPAPQGLFPPSPVFSQELMEQKISTLQAMYQSRGFLDVHISPVIDDEFRGVSGRRFVTLVIEEGTRTTVGAVVLNGIETETAEKIRPSLACQPSKPYSPENAHADRDRILDYLADHGYSHATASWRTLVENDPHVVNLEFQIQTGMQDRVKKIVILGNDHATVVFGAT